MPQAAPAGMIQWIYEGQDDARHRLTPRLHPVRGLCALRDAPTNEPSKRVSKRPGQLGFEVIRCQFSDRTGIDWKYLLLRYFNSGSHITVRTVTSGSSKADSKTD